MQCDNAIASIDEDSDSADESNADAVSDRDDVDGDSNCSTSKPAHQEFSQDDDDDAIEPDGTAKSEPLGSERGSEDEATPSLAPLGTSKPEGAGKKTVHRQLPEWILNPNLVENDIKQFSR